MLTNALVSARCACLQSESKSVYLELSPTERFMVLTSKTVCLKVAGFLHLFALGVAERQISLVLLNTCPSERHVPY